MYGTLVVLRIFPREFQHLHYNTHDATIDKTGNVALNGHVSEARQVQ